VLINYLEEKMKRTLLIFVILLTTASLVFATGGSQSSSGTSGATVQITVELFDRGTDGGRSPATNNAWTKWIHDKVLKDLNIDVTFLAVGRWTEEADITNLLASGSAPDLCYSYNQGMINSFGNQGGILDLAPYVERLLPDMKKLLGSDPALGGDLIYRDQFPDTKKMWSVTNYVTNLARKNLFIRKDWLDKLGLPLPKTTREFHDALVAFKNRDPGGVGANNVIPFGSEKDARWSFSPIIYAYFTNKKGGRDEWINFFTDRPIGMPGYKEGVRVINQWFNEGLIYRDFPLLAQGDDFNNLLKSGRVGAFGGNWDLPYRQDYKINDDLSKNVPGAKFVPVDCIEGPDGSYFKEITDKPGLRIFVPASSKNPEAALRYLNWLCKFENFNYIQIGEPGRNHDLVNSIPRPKAATGEWIMNSSNNIDFTMPINGIELLDPEKNARVLALGYGSTPPEDIVNAYNISVNKGKAPTVYVVNETALPPVSQTLRDKADALLAQAITAPTANFDRVWDEGYRDWLSSGGQAVINERSSLWK
jgi:putative aldouronate transport system substrate-binding protein